MLTDPTEDRSTNAAELDAEIRSLRDAARESGLAPLVEISPTEARERVTGGNRLCSGGPKDVVIEDLSAEHDRHRVNVRIYQAPAAAVTLIYAHGGGWVTGDLDYSDELCRYLATAGVRVVSVDYRLAPEHPFPAAYDDVLAAARWAAAGYGMVALGGDSAGGNLAAAAALSLRHDAAVRLAFLLLVYPVLDTDLTRPSYVENAQAFPIGLADMSWFLDHYVEPSRRQDPRVAPLRAESLDDLPTTHVVAVGHDPLRDDALAFAHRLRAADIAVTSELLRSLCHGFLRFTAASAAARAARDGLVRRVVQLAEEARGLAR